MCWKGGKVGTAELAEWVQVLEVEELESMQVLVVFAVQRYNLLSLLRQNRRPQMEKRVGSVSFQGKQEQDCFQER